MDEPLKPAEAKARIRAIIDRGTVTPTAHAIEEMAKDDMDLGDCLNLLRAGVPAPPDLERGTWRYRIATSRMAVVVAFQSDDALAIVTAWRIE